MSTGSDVAGALGRAIDYLVRVQLDSGEMPVYATTDPTMQERCVLDPSVFPTALVAHCLSFTPQAAPIRARAAEFLAGQMDRDGLWKHWTHAHPQYAQLPPDLDDSACASAALPEAAQPANQHLFLANRNARGLFLTWVIPRCRWTPPQHLRATWRQLRHAPTLLLFFRHTSAAADDVDAVVNANTLFYLRSFVGRERVIEYLVNVLRHGRELACDKWYENPFAVWYFIARAVADVPEVQQLIAQRLTRARPGNALEAALALCAQLSCGRVPADAAVDALLQQQLSDGAWARAALYHGGRRRRGDGSFDAPHPDTPRWGSEALTTAFCVEAVSRWQQVRRS